MTEEIWKDIEDYPNYQVSNKGRVRNKDTNTYLKPGLGGVGYLTVSLYKNKKGNTKNVHELVANAFIRTKEKGETVNHKDGIKTNNDISNLEIVTYKDNLLHAYETGLNKHKKSVQIIETGEIFESQIECAKAIGGDAANVSACLNGRLCSHKGYHFRWFDKEAKYKPFLYDYQMDSIRRLKNGSILCGYVGSGKSRTGLFYYFKENGGWIDEYDGYVPMKNPQDLYIITTAKKRNSLEWLGELSHFLLTTNSEIAYYPNHKVVVDSWNNIGKYKDVEGAFFLLDEQRLVGSGAWVKSFLKIAKHNKWILLTATPGDTYSDYLPVFLANGFFRNKTEFNREHVVYSRFTKYPKIDRYINTGRLERLRRNVLVNMNYQHKINTHHEDIFCEYDIRRYRDIGKTRWNPYTNAPIKNASELCYLWRRVVNTDESRQIKLLEILEDYPKAIIFYNHDHELEILRSLGYSEGTEVAEYNGHKHQPIPSGNKWVYLVQYNAGAEGWECVKTNCIIFYSQNYSYKMMTQAAGRIDRLNTPYTDLYYYHLKSKASIDIAISRALKNKKNFNEGRYVNGKE